MFWDSHNRVSPITYEITDVLLYICIKCFFCVKLILSYTVVSFSEMLVITKTFTMTKH